MHDEQLEYEICLLKESSVILVCPHFGNVSFSYVGTLHVIVDHPILFHFNNDAGIAIIFTVEDVNKLERGIPNPVIRLKGPHDYREDFLKV
jgi:hypothetical protein